MQREHVPEKLLHGEIRLWNVSGPSDVGGVIVDNQIYAIVRRCGKINISQDPCVVIVR